MSALKKCLGCERDFRGQKKTSKFCDIECMVSFKRTQKLLAPPITEKVCRSCPDKGPQPKSRFYENGSGNPWADCIECHLGKQKIKNQERRMRLQEMRTL